MAYRMPPPPARTSRKGVEPTVVVYVGFARAGECWMASGRPGRDPLSARALHLEISIPAEWTVVSMRNVPAGEMEDVASRESDTRQVVG